MPIIREYEQQLSAPRRAVGPVANPDAPLQVGAGMRELGGAISKVGAQITDLVEQNDLVKLQEEGAQLRAEFAAKLQKAKETGEASDPEYVKYAYEQAQEAAGKLAEGKQSRRGIEAARVFGAQFAASIQTQAIGDNAYAIGEQAKQSAGAMIDKNSNTLIGRPEMFHDILRETQQHVDTAFPNAPAELRERIKAEAATKYAVGAVNGRILVDADGAKAEIAGGAWDEFLPPEKKVELLRRAEAKIAEDRGRANLNALIEMSDLADKGQLTRTKALAAYDDGIFTSAPQALSFYNRSQERAKEIERERLLGMAIDMGDPVALVGYTAKEQEKGFGVYAGKLIAAAGDDPEQRADATNRIVTRGRELGLMVPQMKAMLETASPARPAQFAQAASWYESLQAVDPGYAAAHVSSDQAARFHVYSAALSGGASAQQAVELVRLAGDPAKMAEFKKSMGGERLKEIEDLLDPWFSSPASNTGWAKNRVAEMAKLRMTFGEASASEAVEWATGQFEARHALVGGRWIPIQGAASPDIAPALDEYLARVPKALTAEGLTQDELDPQGYELRPDRRTALDGSLQLYERSTGLPMAGRRVTPKEALEAYRKVKEQRAKAEVEDAARRLKLLRESTEQDTNRWSAIP